MTRLSLYGVLLATGAMWGLTFPLTKVVVSTGYKPFGLIFWQLVLSVVLLSALTRVRGTRLPFGRRALGLFAVVSLVGTLIPNAFSYRVAAELPAGVLAIIIALVPMFTLPIATLIGQERFRAIRALGVLLGAVAVVLIVAPSTSLPDPTKAVFVLLAMVAPFCYGVEGNYVAARGTQGMDPMQVLLGASIVGLGLITPVAIGTGQWISPFVPWGAPEWSIVGLGLLHVVAYSAYLWMVGAAGAVFASQVSYVVTATGVGWSAALLSESYSGWIWAALALMLTGLALVQPRDAPNRADA